MTRAAGRHVPATVTLRRAALAACCIALGLTPAAGAQEAASDRTPLVGGGSFLTAPLIETGEYADTLLPAERLYYGVKLEPGQRLRVGAELDVAADKYGDYASGFSLGVQTPLREVDVLHAVDEDVAGNGSVTSVLDERLEYITPPVLSRSAARLKKSAMLGSWASWRSNWSCESPTTRSASARSPCPTGMPRPAQLGPTYASTVPASPNPGPKSWRVMSVDVRTRKA